MSNKDSNQNYANTYNDKGVEPNADKPNSLNNKDDNDNAQSPERKQGDQIDKSRSEKKHMPIRERSNMSKRSNGHILNSGVKSSRKSIMNNHNRSFAGSNPDENLYNNKKTRQILENDKTLLSNRIVMLRKEEERLMKKIKGTREKADKIMEVKKRNEERFKKKLEEEELEKLQKEQEKEKIKELRERRRKEFGRQKQKMLEDK